MTGLYFLRVADFAANLDKYFAANRITNTKYKKVFRGRGVLDVSEGVAYISENLKQAKRFAASSADYFGSRRSSADVHNNLHGHEPFD